MSQEQISLGHKIHPEQALDYITGGNALFTIVTAKGRYTFKVLEREEKDTSKPNYFYVSLLNGPDNVNNYRGIGYIREDENGCPHLVIERRWITEESPAWQCIKYVYYTLLFNTPELLDQKMKDIEIWHNGRCAYCGRILTVPESIERGIGPECFAKTNKFIEKFVI